jgi:hypothetical protein
MQSDATIVKDLPASQNGVPYRATAGGCALCKDKHAMPTTRPYRHLYTAINLTAHLPTEAHGQSGIAVAIEDR